MKVALIALAFFAFGCSSMPNDEIIKEVKKCEAAGFEGRVVFNGWTNRPVEVWCLPKGKQE